MEFIKKATLFDDNNTVVINEDEMSLVYTALETMVVSYGQLLAIKGEHGIPSHEKDIFEGMIVLRDTIKKELLGE